MKWHVNNSIHAIHDIDAGSLALEECRAGGVVRQSLMTKSFLLSLELLSIAFS